MTCGPHREGGSRLRLPLNSLRDEVPASDFLTIHSHTRPPPETSTRFRPEETKSDDSYRVRMTRSDYQHEVRDP